MAKRESTGMPEALRRIAKAERSGATDLVLRGLGFAAIPDSISNLANLKILYLDNNQIAAIPEGVLISV